MSGGAAPLALEARGVSRRFGGVQALDRVSLAVRAGEIHALVGANGAGKSTLIGVLSGAVRPDAGSVAVGGRAVPPGDPVAARRAGCTVVHQELMLFPDRSVAENVAATAPPRGPLGLLDRARRRRTVREALRALAPDLDLEARVGDLPLARQQMVEIGRALHGGGSVFILDEPTSALSEPEVEGLFAALRALARDGAAVVFVSHRLDEVLALAEAVTVLRDGRVEGTWKAVDLDVGRITRAMVGDLAQRGSVPARSVAAGGPVAALRGARAAGVGPIDFAIRPGEVVGLIGLEGSGIATVLQMLGGVTRASGEILIDGRPRRFRHPGDALDAGIAYMPPDRKKGGLWLDRSALWNIAAAAVRRMAPLAWLREQAFERASLARLGEVGVSAAMRRQPVQRLSGGNQQRVLLARSLEMAPRLLLLNDFTRGVDVKAKADIHALVRRLAGQGVAICLTSSDLGEALEVAERIVCMRAGRVVAEGPHGEFDELRALALVSTAA